MVVMAVVVEMVDGRPIRGSFTVALDTQFRMHHDLAGFARITYSDLQTDLAPLHAHHRSFRVHRPIVLVSHTKEDSKSSQEQQKKQPPAGPTRPFAG